MPVFPAYLQIAVATLRKIIHNNQMDGEGGGIGEDKKTTSFTNSKGV
jgi:hypothetical protein